MSKNEFILITVLILVGLIVIIGNYFVLPAWQEMTETRELRDRQSQQLDNLRREHDKIDAYREQEAALDEEIAAMGVSIPAYYAQEKSWRPSAASQQSELEVVNITFGGRVVQSKDAFLKQLTASGQSGAAVSAAGGPDTVTAEQLTLNVSGSFADYMRFLSVFELGSRRVFFAAPRSTPRRTKAHGHDEPPCLQRRRAAGDLPGYDYDAPVPSGRSDPFEPFERGTGGGSGTAQTGARTSTSSSAPASITTAACRWAGIPSPPRRSRIRTPPSRRR